MNSRELLNRVTSNWPAKILSVVAAIALYFSYRIGSLEERFFTVPLAIATHDAYLPVGDVPRSVRVSIRGAADEIFLILEDDIEAYIDLSAHSREGQFRVPVLVHRSGTAEVSEIEVMVDPIEVTVTQEQRVTRTLDIIPELKGLPAAGYELSGYVLEPSTVEVSGPRSAVESLHSVRTDEISLAGRAALFSLRIRARVDEPAVEILGSDLVEFTGILESVIIVRSFDEVPIVLVGLPDELDATLEARSGSMRLRGRFVEMQDLSVERIGLTVDGSTIIAPGSYDLAVEVSVPAGIESLSVAPSRVSVSVRSIGSGTP